MARLDDHWTETVTIRQAWLAMQEFLLTYWKVGGEEEDDVRFLIGRIAGDPADGFIDPAHEREWFEAIAKVIP